MQMLRRRFDWDWMELLYPITEGDHAIGMLKTQLQQVMEQVCCMEVGDFRDTLAKF